MCEHRFLFHLDNQGAGMLDCVVHLCLIFIEKLYLPVIHAAYEKSDARLIIFTLSSPWMLFFLFI